MNDAFANAAGSTALETTDWNQWVDLSGWRLPALAAFGGLLIAMGVWRRALRSLRRRRAPQYHEKLQPYAAGSPGLSDELAAKRRAEASRIVATASTGSIAGYEIVEQVEAVYVDGFRRPEEALEGLKAAAAMKGANAVTNVRQERSAGGKCGAAGDAVIVRKPSTGTRLHPPDPAPSISPIDGGKRPD